MIDGVTVIDADAHVIEDGNLIRRYLPERYQYRACLAYPMENWDRDLAGTLGKYWVRDLSIRLADMDEQGIDLAILYPTLGLFIGRVRETDLAVALCRAYDDFIADLCRQSTRLKAVVMVPLQNIAEAVAEMRRAVSELGFVGAMIPAHGHGKNLEGV